MTLVRSFEGEVLDALTQRVRVLSFSQVARLLDADASDAKRVIDELFDAGLVSVEPHIVAALGDAVRPVFSFVPGQSTPDFGSVAYALRKRWAECAEEKLVLPTRDACKQYGGTRVLPRASEWTHDLWMSEVYLQYQSTHGPDSEWVSGDTLRSDGEACRFSGRVPDACLREPGGAIAKIVEGGGTGYGKSKLNAMHSDYSFCAYEIW